MPRILLVDDSLTLRKMNRIFLKDLQIEVFEASNGQEAMGLLQSVAVDILVTDNHMPVITGLQLCETLHASAAHRHTIVIMLTGDEDPLLPRRAAKAGVRQLIAKRDGGFAVRRAVSEALQQSLQASSTHGFAVPSPMTL